MCRDRESVKLASLEPVNRPVGGTLAPVCDGTDVGHFAHVTDISSLFCSRGKGKKFAFIFHHHATNEKKERHIKVLFYF
jgi:hypothetical protein